MSTDYFRLDRPVAASKADGFTSKTQIIVFFVSILVVISRRPDAILKAQFFAQDGKVWYADTYNTGWLHSLFVAYNGYFQTLPRLAAAISLLFPLLFAPLVLNLIAIVVQVLPINVITSARCRSWAPLNARILMALAYVAMPNSSELNASITDAPWHLALLAALVALAVPSARKIWKVFDVGVVLLSGLTGPFCLALLPIAVAIWFLRRRRWHLVLGGLLAVCCAVQLSAFTTATHSQSNLGATPKLFVQMLAAHVYLGAIAGQNRFASGGSLLLLSLAAMVGTLILIYCLMRASFELRLLVLYCLLVYAASLSNPMVSLDRPQWEVLRDAPRLRYWFFPMLGFVWSMIWCAFSGPSRQLRRVAAVLLILMVFGVAKDWIYPAYSNDDFPALAQRFDMLAPGQAMIFPLYPEGWTMQLTKEGKSCQPLPVGVLDEPKDHAPMTRPLIVRGWVNSSEPKPQVSILVDGVPAQSVVPSVPRPDVDKLYGGGPVKDKGWQATLDPKMTPGTHLIVARARSSSRCDAVLGTASVEVAAPQ